jgi:4-amino-4-deoxy-L-arabinose transferase-like glycosyltransferase
MPLTMKTIDLRLLLTLFFLFLLIYILVEPYFSSDPRIMAFYLLACALFALMFHHIFKGKLFSFKDIGRFRSVFLALLIIGTCATLVYTFHSSEVNQDGMRNVTMGETFLKYGDFKEYNSTGTLVWSHRYSPMMPLYLSIFIGVSGKDLYVLKAASFLIFLLCLYVVYECTKRLYNMDAGLMAAGLTSIIPRLWESTANLQVESMALAVYVLIIFSIIKSLDKRTQYYIIYAGIFAGLGYLTRSSIGYFFIVAGVLGFLWRFYYMGWGTLKNRYYIIAIICFLSFVAVWASRNLNRFWNGTIGDLFISWQTDAHLSECSAIALKDPLLLLLMIIIKFGWLVLLFVPWLYMSLNPLKKMRRLISDERVSGLAIAIFIPLLLSMFIAALFTIGEGYATNPVLNFDNNRYILISIIPLLWYSIEAYDLTVGKRKMSRKVPTVPSRTGPSSSRTTQTTRPKHIKKV